MKNWIVKVIGMSFGSCLLVLGMLISLLGVNAPAADSVAKAKAGKVDKPPMIVELQVTDSGFEPKSIDVKPGSTVKLKIVRKVEATCATDISIPSKKIKKELPLNKVVEVDLGVLEKGEIRFSCGMNMMGGQIHVR